MLHRIALSFVFAIFALSGCAVLEQERTVPQSVRSPIVDVNILTMKIESRELTKEQRTGLLKQQALLKKMIELSAVLCKEAYPPLPLEECFERIYTGMMSQGDEHTEYLNAAAYKKFKESTAGQYGGIAIQLEPNISSGPLISQVMTSGPAEEVGIKVGDKIMKIDNKPYSAFPDMKAVVSAVTGEPNTTVTLHILRPGDDKERVHTIKRRLINIDHVRSELIRDGSKKYGLIATARFGKNFSVQVEKHYKDLVQKNGKPLDGLIFSVEGNPGGLLTEAANTLDLFVDYPAISPVLVRDVNGISVYGDGEMEHVRLRSTPGDITGGIPIVVVVNGGSASASEIFAAGMKLFNRATIAGTSSTFEKGVVQTIREVDEHTAVKFTSAEYLVGLKTNWVAVQCFGVSVDILIPLPASLMEKFGVKIEERSTECKQNRSVVSLGQMKDPPVRLAMKDANPKHFKVGEDMTAAYILWRKEQLDKRELEEKKK